jgi:hypothetical protein
MPKTQFDSGMALHAWVKKYRFVYPTELEKLPKTDPAYHLYAILSFPRYHFIPETILLNKGSLSCQIAAYHLTNQTLSIKWLPSAIKESQISKVSLKCDFPCQEMELTVTTLNGKRQKVHIRASDCYLQAPNIPSNFEILYIGQSFGKNGERDARNRLKDHQKFLEILKENTDSPFPSDIKILLMNFDFDKAWTSTPKPHSFKAAISVENRLMQALGVLSLKELISVTEASLIYLFKPLKNSYLKNAEFQTGSPAFLAQLKLNQFDEILIEISLVVPKELSLWTKTKRIWLNKPNVMSISLAEPGFATVFSLIMAK